MKSSIPSWRNFRLLARVRNDFRPGLGGSAGRNISPYPNIHLMKTAPEYFLLRGDPRFEALINDPKNNAPLF